MWLNLKKKKGSTCTPRLSRLVRSGDCPWLNGRAAADGTTLFVTTWTLCRAKKKVYFLNAFHPFQCTRKLYKSNEIYIYNTLYICFFSFDRRKFGNYIFKIFRQLHFLVYRVKPTRYEFLAAPCLNGKCSSIAWRDTNECQPHCIQGEKKSIMQI